MIELVIVIAVLSISAAIAVPRFATASCHFSGDAAARRVASDLSLAASLARSTGKPQTVAFVTSGKFAGTYTVPGAIRLDRRPGTYTVDLPTAYAAKVVSADFGGTTTATFDNYGGCTGGTLVLQVGTYQKTIKLDPTTSAATVQ